MQLCEETGEEYTKLTGSKQKRRLFSGKLQMSVERGRAWRARQGVKGRRKQD